MFKFMMFCLSAVQFCCASMMKQPDAVLNEYAHTVVLYCTKERATYFASPITDQQAANAGAQYLEDFLHRWSTFKTIYAGGNQAAAFSIVAGMLRDTESTTPPTEEDLRRLRGITADIMMMFPNIRGVFK